MEKRSRILLSLAVAALGVACGSNPGPGPTPIPVRTVVANFNFSQLLPGAAVAVETPVSGGGSASLDATVNWTFASNDVDIYVTTPSCPQDGGFSLGSGFCTILAKADSTTNKPERLTFNVTGGSSYRIWVANAGPGIESGTLEVGLTQ